MSKKNRRKDKGVPMKNRSTTFLPPRPAFMVRPPDDQFYGKSEADAAQEIVKEMYEQAKKAGGFHMMSSPWGGGVAQAAPTKQITLEERVHSSYTHDKEKHAFFSVDGLGLHVPEIIAAPYLPGFVLVNMDDPMALYCIGNFWYTPNAGSKSLEVLVEHFGKKMAAAESNNMFYASGGGGGNIQPSPMPSQRMGDLMKMIDTFGDSEQKDFEDFLDRKSAELKVKGTK